jgi:hypothetical protein
MPLDLVGKLHRTVYITDCPEDSQEDLMHMLLRRCGAVEAWDVVDGRMIVVFRSLNSVSNALTFHGLSFVDLTKRICVWRATDPPPVEATQQLAIQGGSSDAGEGSAATDDATAAQQAEEESRRQQRKERRMAIQQILQTEAKEYDTSSPEGRARKLSELCLRQLKALCTLTAVALTDAKAQLVEKQNNLERLRELVQMQQSDAREGNEPPTSKARVEA